MTWNHFPIFVILTLLPALLGAVLAWRSPRVSKSSLVCSGVAVIVFCVFVAGLWLSLGRPPLRTLGETRLWYSLFMLIGSLGTLATFRCLSPLRGPTRANGFHLPHVRVAFGLCLGETGMGNLLELGPEGNVGRSHLGCLLGLCPLATDSHQTQKKRKKSAKKHSFARGQCLPLARLRLCSAANVLVWRRPPPRRARQHAPLCRIKGTSKG